jgi:acyl carrier protein
MARRSCHKGKMESREACIETISSFIKDNLVAGAEAPGPDAPLLEGNVLDSFAIVELVSHLEDRYGFSADGADFNSDNLGTINRIADYVSRRVVHPK